MHCAMCIVHAIKDKQPHGCRMLTAPCDLCVAASVCRRTHVVRAAKELHFNKNMEALKKMQAGADKLATVVGVTLGPKVR